MSRFPDKLLKHFPTTVSRDLLSLICAEKLGSGIARDVYVCRQNPQVVIKVERRQCSFQNVLEWDFWNTYEHYKKVSRWLAPCHSISPCGRVLVQSRVRPIPADFKLPRTIPSFLTDTKIENCGFLNDRLVACDYAFTLQDPDTKRRRVWWT